MSRMANSEKETENMSKGVPSFLSSFHHISSLHIANFFQARAQGYVLICAVALVGTVLIASAEIHLFYSPIKLCVQW